MDAPQVRPGLWPGSPRQKCEAEFDIGETGTTVDAQLFIDAAERARPIWPDGGDQSTHLSRAEAFRRFRGRGEDGIDDS